MADYKAKDLKKCTKYGREMAKMATGVMQRIENASFVNKFVKGLRGARTQITKGEVEIGQHRSSLTADEQKRLAPTQLDKMEVRILKMLAGWSIQDIECLLVHRVIPEAKRKATVPKSGRSHHDKN